MMERLEETASKENTLIIMASEGGFPFDGFVSEGYSVISAYKRVGLFSRIIREICFRIPLLPKKCWYNPELCGKKATYIYVRDAIITKKYLLWLQEVFPRSQINFSYENMVGKARHLKPHQIPKGIRVWTYDSRDSEVYHLLLKKVTAFFKCYVKEGKTKKYDLLFVGRDKGRGDWLIKLEKYLNDNGIKTYFHITSDGRFSRVKAYYKNHISYDDVIDYVSQSRAVLNVGMENQKGVTVRDIESYFYQIKLVTTNDSIIESDIFDENNTFFLRKDNWKELVVFLNKPYYYAREVSWENHTIDDMIQEITQ